MPKQADPDTLTHDDHDPAEGADESENPDLAPPDLPPPGDTPPDWMTEPGGEPSSLTDEALGLGAASSLPYCRDLKRGDSGLDVRAVKRAVSRWDDDVYPWVPAAKGGFTRYFGGRLETAVKTFQRRNGLKVDGVIGRATRAKLEEKRNAAGQPVFDRVARELLAEFCRDYERMRRRLGVLASAFWLYEHRFDPIRYSQRRPFQRHSPPLPPWVPTALDCSAYVTDCYEGGRAANPNGRPWDGLGYTGTLIANGRRIALDDAQIGDLIFYGSTTRPSPAFPLGSPTHVAVYVGTVNGVRSVLSHGSFPMKLLPVGYRAINQVRSYL